MKNMIVLPIISFSLFKAIAENSLSFSKKNNIAEISEVTFVFEKCPAKYANDITVMANAKYIILLPFIR